MKPSKAILYMLAIAIAGCQSGNENEKEKTQTQEEKTEQKTTEVVRDKLQPPLPSADIPMMVRNHKAERPLNMEMPSGSVIKIPANAFMDENGEVVKGDVKISYREMRDPVDMFFAGVPMSIEHDGEILQLQSEGMFEFYAEQDGKALQINPEAQPTAYLKPVNDASGASVLYFDEGHGGWQLGEDIQTTETSIDELMDYGYGDVDRSSMYEYKGLGMQETEEVILSLNHYKFNQKVKFALAEEEKERFKSQYADMSVLDWELSPNPDGSLQLTMIGTEGDVKFRGYLTKESCELFRQLRNISEKADERRETQKEVYTEITINATGIYNCDRLITDNSVDWYKIVSQDKEGTPLVYTNLYLLDKTDNTIYSVRNYQLQLFDNEAALVGLTADGLIAYYSVEEYKALPRDKESGSEQIVQFDVLDKERFNELRSVIGFH